MMFVIAVGFNRRIAALLSGPALAEWWAKALRNCRLAPSAKADGND